MFDFITISIAVAFLFLAAYLTIGLKKDQCINILDISLLIIIIGVFVYNIESLKAYWVK